MSVSRKLLLLRLARDLAPTPLSSGTEYAPRTSLKVGIDSAAGAAILRIDEGVKREDVVDLGSPGRRVDERAPHLRASPRVMSSCTLAVSCVMVHMHCGDSTVYCT